jgi:hypothetical protein
MCTPSFGAEPNEPKTQVQFEIRNDRPSNARVPSGRFQPPSGSTHFAVLFVKGGRDYNVNKPIEAMLETSPGKAISPEQGDIISNQSIQMRDSGRTISDYSYFQIFGVSENDTKKMAEAFLEVLTNENKVRKQSLLSQRQKWEERRDQVEKQIPRKEKEDSDVENRLSEVRKMVRYLSAKEALRAIEELNRTLDELNIELVGIRVKLQAIGEELVRTRADALKSGDARRKAYETMIWPRLEQMRIDETIAIRVAEAKKETTASIRDEAAHFFNLSNQRIEIGNSLSSLKTTASNHRKSLEIIDGELAKLDQSGIPVKVFQNKVAIYPIAGIGRR